MSRAALPRAPLRGPMGSDPQGLSPTKSAPPSLLVGIQHRLALGASPLEPVRGQLLPNLLETVPELWPRRLHLHSLGPELVDVPQRLLRCDLPASLFRRSGSFQQCMLLALIEGGKSGLVHDDDVLRDPGMKVVPVAHRLPDLDVVAG